jgi:soluble lytic murein transglycosylase-like protein
MPKRLQIALMAGLFFAASVSLPSPMRGADGEAASGPITTSEEKGRKIYVNDFVIATPARHDEAGAAPRRKLKYWSSKEQRWKAVPPANAASMKAAQSAAAEVSEYLGRESAASANAKIAAANFSELSARASVPSEAPGSSADGAGRNALSIDSAIEQAAARHNVDPNLVRAVVKVESNFNPNAVSRKGAMGLMQLMPATARQLKVSNPFDPEQNVDAGVRHLKQLLESYNGDIKLTLAAYNAGAGAVARSAGVPRYAETQNYVRRITHLYYGESPFAPAGPTKAPVLMQRDARGVLYISNTD